MKICPECALANEERFPACVVCHAPLADVRSTPAADPAHPEHAHHALTRRRRALARRQLAWAVGCYVLLIYGLFAGSSRITDPEVHFFYASGALVVGLAVAAECIGGFAAGIAQGAVGVVLALAFGPRGMFVAFMLAGYVVAPMLLSQWVEMIHDANR